MKTPKFTLHKNLLVGVLLVILALTAGYLMGKSTGHDAEVAEELLEAAANDEDTIWTCSMHPQIRQPEPGQCPICGMDLIPVEDSAGDENANPREISLSPGAVKLAGIQTAPVERRYVTKDITAVGTVSFDESRVEYISSWIPGRIDRLYVDYTGTTVRKGDHLVDIYSPELFTAQEEYLQTLRTSEELTGSKAGTAGHTALLTAEAAREKLRLLGMTDGQIDALRERGTPAEHITIYSTSGGVVVHKNATAGMYVNTGAKIYTIADLSHVWVMLDIYESDLQWLRYGQEVTFTAEAYPGKTFTGRIAFIDPVVNPRSRTVKMRVNVPNDDGMLKPDMFVKAAVQSRIADGGRVMSTYLADKYICPMHPSVVRDHPDDCPICGMDLVTTESLGYAVAEDDGAPLVIPRSAPLITGKRAVVYVAHDEPGVYEGREIVLGPRAGDWYQVASGLTEGDRVVVNGNFKLDSALQIQAKPSMMNPAPASHGHGGGFGTAMAAEMDRSGHETAGAHEGHDMEDMDGTMSDTARRYDAPEEFLTQLDGVYRDYFGVQYALSHDDPDSAKTAAGDLLDSLKDVDMTLLEHDPHMAWMERLGALKKAAGALAAADGIEAAREAFEPLSNAAIATARQFGHTDDVNVYQFHCPMAFDSKGADWLQNKDDLENPYFGSMMFKCGTLIEEIE